MGIEAFAESFGLAVEDIKFLSDLPEDLQTQVFAKFDPSGTKDGNIIGRLQAYVAVVMRRNGLEPSWETKAPAPVKEQRAVDSHREAKWKPQSGGADETVSTAVVAFVDRLGLGDQAAMLLANMPGDLQVSVVRGFDPAGTKDGNVLWRLLGYVRSLWSRRLHLDETAIDCLHRVPQDVLMTVLMEFDPDSVGNANMSRAIVQFADDVMAQNGTGGYCGDSGDGGSKHSGRVVAPQQEAARPRQSRPHSASSRRSQGTANNELDRFVRSLGLDPSDIGLLAAMPEEYVSVVISSFDPSGTKDGNVWGRLMAFARSVWSTQVGMDKETFEHLKTLPEETQKRTLLEWSTSISSSYSRYDKGGYAIKADYDQRRRGGTAGWSRTSWCVGDPLQQFVQQWGLDQRAASFVAALPADIRGAIIVGFDGSGTKDGNVWGRLLGYARHTWSKMVGLDWDSATLVKSLPEEAQVICMTHFDPSGTKDGNVAGRLQGFVKKAMKMAGATQAPVTYVAAAPIGSDPRIRPVRGGPVAGDSRGAPYDLRGHAGGVGGTAHVGGVGGTAPGAPYDLRGSGGGPKHVAASAAGGSVRERRGRSSGLRADPAVADFLARCSLELSALEYLETLSEELLARVLEEFDPTGTKDGNVLGRLQGYVRYLEKRHRTRSALDDWA